MIVKKFLPATLETIQIVNETPEIHAKKSVQMHTLAQSLASQLAISVEKGGNKDFFGHCFRYVNSYIGQITKTGDDVTIDDFAGNKFTKYVNNNGLLPTANDEEMQRKA